MNRRKEKERGRYEEEKKTRKNNQEKVKFFRLYILKIRQI